MTTPPSTPVSSLKSLTRSIETDYYVYRWFTFLIHHPPIRQNLIKSSKFETLYRRFQKNSFLLNVSLLMIFSGIIFIIGNGQWHSPWIIFILSAAAYKLHNTQRTTVSLIGNYFVSQEYNQHNFATKSLYEISEIYAQRYNIPSLISTMCQSDRLCRKVLLVILFFDLIIYIFFIRFSLVNNLLFMAGLYNAILILINTRSSYALIRP